MTSKKVTCGFTAVAATLPTPIAQQKNIVIYDYQPSRAAACPKEYLKGYSGYLQVDGYAAYDSLGMAHVRRKFVDAQKVQPKGKVGRADWAVAHIQKLYHLEAQLAGKATEEKLAQRQVYALPLLTEFKACSAASRARNHLGHGDSLQLKLMEKTHHLHRARTAQHR